MPTQILTSNAEWESLIKQLGAVKVKSSRQRDMPKSAVFFETTNFGWILSAPDSNGKRLILAKF